MIGVVGLVKLSTRVAETDSVEIANWQRAMLLRTPHFLRLLQKGTEADVY